MAKDQAAPSPPSPPQVDATTAPTAPSGVLDGTVAPRGTAGSTSTEIPPGTTLGPYRLVEKLGEGGMGAVYKAVHTRLDKVVAVKVLPPQMTQDADSVARFQREMKAVGKLEHPNIVRAMDAGEIGGTYYLAMEYVEGTDLQKLIKAKGPLSVVNACKAIKQAATALNAAHRAGLIHRDIKPSNLLVAKGGHIKLLDLGLARLTDDAGPGADLTTLNQSFGTPDYMAPEQWSNAHEVDGRADLYALGCTLFFLLTGRAPFQNEQCRTPTHKMTAHVTTPPPDLAAANPRVPPGLAAIYQRLLAKQPEDRFATAAEVVQALAPFCSQADAKTTPPSAAPPASPAPSQPLGPTITTCPVPKPQATPRKPPSAWLIGLALAGAALVILAGVTIIRIINQDGTVTEIKVPDTAKIEIVKPPSNPPVVPTVTTPQPQNYALEFDGKTSYVEIPALKFKEVIADPHQPITIEAFASAQSLLNDVSGHRRIASRLPVYLAHVGERAEANRWKFAAKTVDGSLFAQSPFQDNQVVHVAGVYDGKTVRCFLNGKLDPGMKATLSGNGTTRIVADEAFGLSKSSGSTFLGAGRSESNGQQTHFGFFHGLIDEVRISKVARYDQDFTPKTRFEPDEHTLALYHFDEGAGDVLQDSSGNNHHGKIVNAKWVPGIASAREIVNQPDYAQERAVAEWVLSIGGKVTVADAAGKMLALDKLPLPGGEFTIRIVELVKNPRVAGSDLARLGKLARLATLDLASNPQVTDADVAHLGAVHSLVSVDLTQTGITDAALAHLAGCSKLQNLRLGDCPVTIAGLRPLAGLKPKLLYLRNSQLRFSDLPEIVRLFPSLETIDVRGFVPDAEQGLSPLAGLPRLKAIYVEPDDVIPDGPHQLRKLVALRSLLFEKPAAPLSTNFFGRVAQLPQVELLQFTRARFDDAALPALAAIPTVQTLQLTEWSGGDMELMQLASMAGLKTLLLSKTQVTAAGAQELHKRRPDVAITGDFNIPAEPVAGKLSAPTPAAAATQPGPK